MKTVRRFHKQTSVRTLVLAALLTLAALAPAPAHAATSYTVSDEAGCATFLSAIGATGDARIQCYVYSGTLGATDTLTVAGDYSFGPQGNGSGTTNFTNNGIVNINSAGGGAGGLYNAGIIDNQGSININDDSQNLVTINNHGTINISAAFYNHGTINNSGTIRVACGVACGAPGQSAAILCSISIPATPRRPSSPRTWLERLAATAGTSAT